MSWLSLLPEKERLRATLVIGLIASIVALRFYLPEATTPRVSLIFGVLLAYWFLYVLFTAYGISVTENVKWSKRLRRLGDLFFSFAFYFVVSGVLLGILMEKFGVLIVLEWNYFTIWSLSFIAFLAPEILAFLKQLWNWKRFPAYVKANWRVVIKRWLLFFLMSLPLLALQFYKLVL
jgi:hypothetical protein